jgi:hypothetical protein
MQPCQLIEQLLVGLPAFLYRVTLQENSGRSARTNPSYERIDQYLERDLTTVEKRDLSELREHADPQDWRRVGLSLPRGSVYGKGRQQAADGSRAVAVGVVGAAEVPRASSGSESIVAASGAQPGVGEFATPPGRGGDSVRPPRARSGAAIDTGKATPQSP